MKIPKEVMKTIELAIKGTPHHHQLLKLVDHINPNLPPPNAGGKKKGEKKNSVIMKEMDNNANRRDISQHRAHTFTRVKNLFIV